MINKSKLFFSIILVSSIFVSCAKTPEVAIWRPWTRTIKTKSNILLNSRFSVNIEGNTKPLLGEESVLQEKIRNNLSNLLKRRGFRIVKDKSDYDLLLRYRTERLTESNININKSYSSSPIITDTDNSASLATGIFLAAILNNSKSKKGETATQYSETGYFHTISLEIKNKKGELIFKGESTWKSEDIDLIYEIKPAIKILICELPKDKKIIPHVRELRKDKVTIFSKLYCNDKWYSCPALPNRIFFPSISSEVENPRTSSEVENPRALPAYLDLIQTAEYALPTGTDEYSDLLDSKLWSRFLLGGVYTLGPLEDKVNILIVLKGQTEGYKIDKCWIATDEEYKKYKNRMQEWKDALYEFYNLYL
ncbi:MAG TPA: hypothetical protein VKO43_03015 [Candidatus Krumholzibacteriaceae bacterium]|nr:hypothetical protein [Candidatus Krumholzibacteriaceae bacterium]